MENEENKTSSENKKIKIVSLVISPDNLKSVSEKKLKRPAFARNAPVSSFHLLRLTNKQLTKILNVKLKPVKTKERRTKWCSSHTVLKELKEKTTVKD